MDRDELFGTQSDRLPVIAILRGVTPGEAPDIGEALTMVGVRAIEVPLNSPDAFASIAALANALGQRAVVGAGTVLAASDVAKLADVGGSIAVSPDCKPSVIEAALRHGITPMPGIATPTEAFTAIEAGAEWLKLFPAAALGPSYLHAISAVLPPEAKVLAVGGIGPAQLAEWRSAPVAGYGIGSDIYRPGDSSENVACKAAAIAQILAQ